MLAVALVLALQDTAGPATPAADIVARARAARERNERLVTSYTATVTQRIGVGLRALSRDRMLFSQELAASIEWYRDRPSRIEVVGARQRVPIALRGVQVPDDLDANVRWLVLNPAEDYLRFMGGTDSEGFVYPLKAGSESDYRFEAGDTTVISLPDGRQVRLLELVVHPRRSDFRLMDGSLWFDADSYGLVRAVFRPARPWDFRRDADEDDRDDMPAFLNPGAEVKYVTVEYGLYEFRWWMPRFIAIDATATLGSMANMPLRFELVYSGYRVQGGTPPDPARTFQPAGTVRRNERSDDSALVAGLDSLARKARADSIQQVVQACIARARAQFDTTAMNGAERQGRRQQVRRDIRRCTRRDESDDALTVVIPADTMSLLSSSALGEPILDMGDVISERELQQLGREIQGLGAPSAGYSAVLPTGLSSVIQHARYNRVEALSLGLSGRLNRGPWVIDGLARIGVADWEPNGELGLTRRRGETAVRLGGYRRLAAVNPDTRPFGGINSTMAFFFGRDDGDYFRTLGAELTGTTGSNWLSWRLYGEQQSRADVETQFSLPHVFGQDTVFRPNIVADRADQAGAAITLRGRKTLSTAVVVGSDLTVDGAVGTFEYGRAALTLRGAVAPPGPLAFALEGSAGWSSSALPVQGNFYLGGPATLRGYDGAVTAGESYWRGRFEVGNAFPAFRVALFTDAAWAGARDEFTRGRPLIGVGAGVSVLDGLFRMDLARATRAPTGWRFDFYVDGIF